MTFVDLRDRYGITQLVFNMESNSELCEKARKLGREFVIMASGTVRERSNKNPKIPTGDIEIEVAELAVLNRSEIPPFTIEDDTDGGEELRMKYRYLDLRRNLVKNNIILRHNVAREVRNYMDSEGFVEIETPILFKTTPEGARDYLVPSRVHPGEFYALPQSPQQLKQMLQVAGVERYFQIARCFRDEDQRGDRQPEFTQLDLEMSFVERNDVMNLIEELFTGMVKEVVPHKHLMVSPWPRITYHEALERYGKDNPDIRFGLELKDISDLAEGCGFNVFEGTIANGGHVRGINAKGLGDYTRRQIDELTEWVKQFGAKGLAYVALPSDGSEMRSPIAKFFSEERFKTILGRMEAEKGDLLLFVADKPMVVFDVLGRLRVHLGDLLGLRDPDLLGFCWVIDFPFVMWNEEEKRWDPSHHLFTAPMPEDISLLDSKPGQARGTQYDLVLNNYEVGGGSIRIHKRELQEKVFKLIGLDPDVARERFGHMLEAFEYGTPPHGGIAPGIDRICMILADEPNIREVIAFPKNQAARDVMGDAPSPVEPKQLKELHIKLDLPVEKK